MRPFLLRISAALAIVISFHHQLSDAAPTTSQSGASQAAASPTASDPTELKVLQRQLEDSRKFQDQILATVFWSLGTLATVATLLVGFGWFVNFRVYERDKASIERELRTQISVEVSELKNSSLQAFSAASTALEQSLVTKLASASSQAEAAQKVTIDALERRLSVRSDAGDSALADVRSEVLDLKLASKLAQREKWLVGKVPRNVLQASVSALEVAIEMENEYSVGQVLDLISRDISSIISANAVPIDNFLIAQVIAVLDTVIGKHAHAAASLKAGATSLLGK